MRRLYCIGALALALAGSSAAAPVPAPGVTVDITSRRDAFAGQSFGPAGPYEVLTGVAHLTIAPGAPANKAIVDLDKSPRDAQGLVHYDVDLQILRPRDPQRARRVMLYEVVNRGMRLISTMNGGSIMDIDPFARPGNGFIMRQGYTVVWSGWQGDITRPGLLAARFPVATDQGRPITGRVSTEAIFDDTKTTSMILPYPAATLDQAGARLTVRERTDDAERPLAADDWHFDDARHVTLKRPADMDAGAIYHFTYIARDPIVMGLGFSGVRDLVAFLRHGGAAAGNPLADIAKAPCERGSTGACAHPGGGAFDTTIAYGASQSARYLRDYLWQGFNRDGAGRRVFDGMLAMVPGARQTFTNMRFAEPGRFSRQHEDHDVPGFTFPYTYATMRDPITGQVDGILKRCTADGTCPKLIHLDTSGEFWQAGASLVGTGGSDADVAFPGNVRAYMIAGGAHAPGMAPPMCQNAANPFNYSSVVRALMVDLVDWTNGRQAPPASRWPKRSELQEVAALASPDLSAMGITWPRVANRPVAPVGSRGWPVLVPKVDADGNDVAGIHLPEVAAPLGTYLGWNARKAGFGQGDLCLVFGSYAPFASDKSARGRDPRLALSERYAGNSRATRYAEAAETLRRERLLLAEDTGER